MLLHENWLLFKSLKRNKAWHQNWFSWCVRIRNISIQRLEEPCAHFSKIFLRFLIRQRIRIIYCIRLEDILIYVNLYICVYWGYIVLKRWNIQWNTVRRPYVRGYYAYVSLIWILVGTDGPSVQIYLPRCCVRQRVAYSLKLILYSSRIVHWISFKILLHSHNLFSTCKILIIC